MLLVRGADDGPGRRVGRIVEVEAYGGEQDLASHARFGRTDRNAPMYGPAGRAYVYLVYGMHACLNVVTGVDGDPAATLIRAVEPLEGVDEMRRARMRVAVSRARDGAEVAALERIAATPSRRLASGPGLVGEAFGISAGLNGVDLLDPEGELRLEPTTAGERPPPENPSPGPGAELSPGDLVVASARIGVAYAGDPWRAIAWRFHLRGHPSVSRNDPGS